MKEFSGKIVAADRGDNTITIQCENISGAVIGQDVVLMPIPPKPEPTVKDLFKHQPGE